MAYRRWRKKGQGSQRKDAGFLTRVQRFDRLLYSPGPSFESVPNWEKRFCRQMKWRDFCEKKMMMHLYPEVLDWDDSAGKEAFYNAKARYWAEINHLPSEIPFPDPNMYIQEVNYDAYIDPSLLEDLYKFPPPPPEIQIPNFIKIVPTGWDVDDPRPSDFIPKFISFIPFTADDIIDSSAPVRPTGWDDGDNQNNIFEIPATIIPTGWGDEEDSESINALDLRGRQLNGASTLNNTDKNVENMFGTAKHHSRGWKQVRRKDNMLSSETNNPWEHHEHHEHRNGAARIKVYGRRGGDRSFSSILANLRCHEQGGYHKDRRTKCIKEQYFWRQKHSLDRGISCTPENH